MERMNEELLSDIFLNLARINKWGKSHTSFDNIVKGFPKHIRGEVKKAGKYAMKKGYLLNDESSDSSFITNLRFEISKPTGYGKEVSLNPDKAEDIKELIGRYHFVE